MKPPLLFLIDLKCMLFFIDTDNMWHRVSGDVGDRLEMVAHGINRDTKTKKYEILESNLDVVLGNQLDQ